MRVTRSIVAGGFASALALGSIGAGPAMANEAAGTVEGGGLVGAVNIGGTSSLATFTCAARASDVALWVGISECVLVQNGTPIASALPVSVPGVMAVTATYAVIPGLGQLKACWTVNATFAVDNSTATESGCGPGFLPWP